MRRNLILSTVLTSFLAACAGGEQEAATPEAKSDQDKEFPLTYPELDKPGGEVLLENEHVVVQRFIVGPGEWEGIHAHPGSQV